MKMLGTHRLDSPGKTHGERAGGRVALVEPERLAGVLPAPAKTLRLVGGLSDGEAAKLISSLYRGFLSSIHVAKTLDVRGRGAGKVQTTAF